jgi:hypothetical protein
LVRPKRPEALTASTLRRRASLTRDFQNCSGGLLQRHRSREWSRRRLCGLHTQKSMMVYARRGSGFQWRQIIPGTSSPIAPQHGPHGKFPENGARASRKTVRERVVLPDNRFYDNLLNRPGLTYYIQTLA